MAFAAELTRGLMRSALTIILIAAGTSIVCAQPASKLERLEKLLKTTDSEVKFEAILTTISETRPETKEDIKAIGRLSDRFPRFGKKIHHADLRPGTYGCNNKGDH